MLSTPANNARHGAPSIPFISFEQQSFITRQFSNKAENTVYSQCGFFSAYLIERRHSHPTLAHAQTMRWLDLNALSVTVWWPGTNQYMYRYYTFYRHKMCMNATFFSIFVAVPSRDFYLATDFRCFDVMPPWVDERKILDDAPKNMHFVLFTLECGSQFRFMVQKRS